MRGPALVLLIALCACERKPSAAPAQTQAAWEKVGVRVVDGVPQLGEVEIELKRGACEGWCAAYKVKLSGNGTLTYTGKWYVKTKGEHTTAFDPEKLLPLLQRLAELDFLSKHHECSVRVSDNSQAGVTLRLGTRSTSAWDQIADSEDLGQNSDAADALWHRRMYELENAIDSAANIEAWIGTQAEREAHREEWR